MIHSVDDIFALFGGPTSVGEAIGVPRTHAAAMKSRGSIPSTYWPALVQAAADRGIKGVTLEVMVRIAPKRREAAA